MIDPATFAHWLGVIADRCNRPLQPATTRAYYDALSRHLTTEDFIVAAQLVFETETWWPVPAVFVDKVRPTPGPTLEASNAFTNVIAITALSPNATQEIREVMGEVALRAYLGVGGYARFKGLLEDDVKWVRREFLTCYGDAWKLAAREKEIAQLRATEQAKRLAAGSEVKRLASGQPMSLGQIMQAAALEKSA